jgi:hypothetical protein
VVKPVLLRAERDWKNALDLSMPVASRAIAPAHKNISQTNKKMNTPYICILNSFFF